MLDLSSFEFPIFDITNSIDRSFIMKNSLFLFVLLFSVNFSFATSNPPSNDECGDEITINGSFISGTTTCATGGMDQTCAFTDHQVWYDYTVSNSEDVDLAIVVTPNSSNGNPASSLSLQVIYNCSQDFTYFDEPCGSTSVNVTNIDEGNTLKILVGSESGGEGDFTITLEETPCEPPINDLCGDAISLLNGVTVEGTLACASEDFNSCFNWNVVYYEYEVEGPGLVDVEFELGFINADVVLNFFTDCNGTVFDPDIDCFNMPYLFENIAAGTVIYAYAGGGAGEFEITVTETANGFYLLNDMCSNAKEIDMGISCDIVQVCDGGDAFSEVSNFGTSCDFETLTTAWYTFTTNANTTSVSIEELEFFAVFENDCPPTSVVQNCSGGFVEFGVEANTTYLMVLGQDTDDFIDVCFQIDYIESSEYFDCTVVPNSPLGQSTGNNTCAEENISFCGPSDHVVYYSYTATGPGSQDVSLTLQQLSSTVEMGVWIDCNGTSYDNSLPCSGTNYLLPCVPAGTTIIIPVGSNAGDEGEFILEITEAANPNPNNSCSTAEIININENCEAFAVSGSTFGACPELFSTNCDFDEWSTVWFSFTTLEGTSDVGITNFTDGFLYEVLADNCPVESNVVDCQNGDSSFSVLGLTTYLIIVANPNMDGDFSFDITYNGINTIEICDGIDNNCDGQIDEGVGEEYWLDSDGDSYGDPNFSVVTCSPPSNYVQDNTDCDDSNLDINPGVAEISDNDVDENCDGIIAITDVDMDGFGINEDCDDDNANINPDAQEIPNNNIDENCDGEILIIDEDMDGFNSSDDCDDTNAEVFPGNLEVCDGLDNDCNGIVDDGVLMNYYPDNDMDGYGVDSGMVTGCEIPEGYADNNLDCNDNDSAINPGVMEIANNDIDENCDGLFDIIDNDMDGYSNTEDCDDNNASINPGAVEIPDNDIDEDCDGFLGITDEDEDGYGIVEDCNDLDPDINPGAVEIPNNDIDENCDGETTIIDLDNDGWNSDEDCNDENENINPDALEIANNGIDEDCDGEDLIINDLLEIGSIKLKMYPNPVPDVLTIETKQDISFQYEVYDVDGKEIMLGTNTAQRTEVNVSDLECGVYLVVIKNTKTKIRSVYRFIKL